jgi:hypothetical protein
MFSGSCERPTLKPIALWISYPRSTCGSEAWPYTEEEKSSERTTTEGTADSIMAVERPACSYNREEDGRIAVERARIIYLCPEPVMEDLCLVQAVALECGQTAQVVTWFKQGP